MRVSISKALRQASEDSDFGPAIDLAHKRYLDHVSPERPNQALEEFWPSSSTFRSILYRAGKRLSGGAATYLGSIPDVDQRPFARIELAAALAGLPNYRILNANFTQARVSRQPTCLTRQ